MALTVRVDLTSINIDTSIYQPAATKKGVVTVRLCNRGSGSAKVRLAITGGSAPAASDWIEYDTVISGPGVMEITGLVLNNPDTLYARTDTATVSCVVYGIEE
jgi:hypothetical protein